MNKENLIRHTPHPPEPLDSSLNASKRKNKIKELLELYQHLSMIEPSKNNFTKKTIKKIKGQHKSVPKKTRQVRFDPNTKEPSKKLGNLLNMILTEYQRQLRDKSEEEPILSIEAVIEEAIKTGVCCGENIEITYSEGVLQAPQTIGIINTELFIRTIQLMNFEQRVLSRNKKTIEANAAAEIVEQKTTHTLSSPEENHLPLINTKRHCIPLRKYKPFFRQDSSSVTKEKQTITNELETSPRNGAETWAHI